jgi:flagellar basal-body rod protein FlgF
MIVADHEANMQSPLYVALSSQLALQKRLDTIGTNIANASTTGYRADSVSFSSLITSPRTGSVAFVSQGDTTVDRRSGALQQTGNALDVAVEGDGWLALRTPAGIAYTRDGRLSMSTTGQLMSSTGYPVLDVGNAPIQIDPNGGPPTIARDGMISQGAQKSAAIGLFHIPPDLALRRYGDSAFLSTVEADPVLDFHNVKLTQGYLEQSNVNSTTEMMNLITVSRAFQGAAAVIDDTERKLDDAIRTLGASGR